MEKVYSIDGENFKSWEEIEEEIKNKDIKEIYEGEKVQKKHFDYIDGDDIIEMMTNRAYDDFDDFAENYCKELEEPEHKKEIEKLILNYLNKNVKQPDFFEVENIRKKD